MGWCRGARCASISLGGTDNDNERLCNVRGDPVTYTVERTHWSNRVQQFVPVRLTYSRTWIAERGLWSDFLVRAEELEGPQEPHPIAPRHLSSQARRLYGGRDEEAQDAKTSTGAI